MKFHAKGYAVLFVCSAVPACGGKLAESETDSGSLAAPVDADVGDASAYLGSWTCSVVSSATIMTVPQQGIPETEVATFVTTIDDGLSMWLETTKVGTGDVNARAGDNGGAGCNASYELTVSGATATGFAGPTCVDRGASFTFQSATFVVSGDTATIDVAMDVTPTAGSTVDRAVETTTGACTKN